ncbi:MAG: hypothetical protein WD965_02445 [Actinomycetota bacterium]
MARLDLSGALTKFEWAQKHARELKRDIFMWADLDSERPVTFRRKIDIENHTVDFWVETMRPLPHRWSLMLGDTLTNFRGALDYLPAELVGAGDKPELKDSTSVYFPLSEKNFSHFINKSCNTHLPGVRMGVCRRLSPFQPYTGRRWDHPGKVLLRLFRLSGREKHRELVVTVIRPHVYEFRSPLGTRTQILHRGQPGEPFEPHTKAVSINIYSPFPPEQKPDVSVDFDAARQIAVQDGPYLLPFVGQVERLVAEVLGKFL